MKQLLHTPSKLFTFLIWILWIPVVLFCTHLLVSPRNGSIISFIFVSTVLLVILLGTGKLSNHLGVGANYVVRIRKQFLYGFLSPISIVVVLAILFDEFIDDDAIKQVHVMNELSVLVMFSYIVNSFYLVFDIDRNFLLSTVKFETPECYDEKMLVYHKGDYVPVNLMEIASVYQKDQINWLVTFKGEQYILDLSLKTVQSVLNESLFFRVNRSQIVHKDAINKLRPGDFGKINLGLNVNGLTATVSKGRAKDFRKWFYK